MANLGHAKPPRTASPPKRRSFVASPSAAEASNRKKEACIVAFLFVLGGVYLTTMLHAHRLFPSSAAVTDSTEGLGPPNDVNEKASAASSSSNRAIGTGTDAVAAPRHRPPVGIIPPKKPVVKSPIAEFWWLETEDDDFKDRTYSDPDVPRNKLHALRKVGHKDPFPGMCGRYRFDITGLPDVSVIVTVQNEQNGMLPLTVHSILARTPPDLLKEIIVVDDNGIPPELRGDRVNETEFLELRSLSPKVTVLQNHQREGCARSRMIGARAAAGEVLMFVDSHVEMMSATWYQHLLIPIVENPRTLAMQLIEIIDDMPGRHGYPHGRGDSQFGVINDNFLFDYQYARFEESGARGKETPGNRLPFETPFGPGSLFAIRRDEFRRLGGYDKGLYVWGGENTELVLKSWMCGGRVVMVPCSRVGHMYRVNTKEVGRWPPYLPRTLTDRLGCGHPGKFMVNKHKADNFTKIITRNNIRIMSLWIGDHPAREGYYRKKFRSRVLPPEWKQYEDELKHDAAALEQAELKEKNQCHDFEWFDRHVYMKLLGKHHPWHPSRTEVSCGSFTAKNCAGCHSRNVDPSDCGGDCEWCPSGQGSCIEALNPSDCPVKAKAHPKIEGKPKKKPKLRPKKEAPGNGVNCGGHRAIDCASCPQGYGADWCHKDCRWCPLDGGSCVDAHDLDVCRRPVEKEEESPEQRDADDGEGGREGGAERPGGDDEKEGLTVSVVLACGFEHEYFEKTARSIFDATPPDVLEEIVIVDDASDPPLKPLFPEYAKYKVRFIREEEPHGVTAKHIGAMAAKGDVLVFFDCHVKPAPGYWKPFVRAVEENYRRVVVPTITSLDTDTWTEFGRPSGGSKGGMSKCYLTFDGEFKWTSDGTPYVPILSGGLLSMSRQWYLETGGYDIGMKGWGGENLDQSLRIWLCGGEIVSAPESYVAHMWRDAKHSAKYKVGIGDGPRNRAVAIKAHTGPWFVNKTLTFPAFERFRDDGGKSLDTSGVTDSFKDLKCHSFEWFLAKFSYIYRDAGLVPTEVFQIELVGDDGGSNPLCLQLVEHDYWNNAGAATDEVIVSPCVDTKGPDATRGTQYWHRSNRRVDGSCCSGLRVWNTDQCIAGKLRTGICSLNPDMEAELTSDGLLHVEHKCLSVEDESDLQLTGCEGASKWRKRSSFAPVEYTLLSPSLQKAWLEKGDGVSSISQ